MRDIADENEASSRTPGSPIVLIAPQLVVVIVFFFWPAFDSLRLSVFKVTPFGDREIFVGLENFKDLLTAPEYGRSVLNSFIFSLGVTTLGLAVSLFLASLANQKIRGLTFYRTAILWTYGIAPPVSGIIWLFIFHPSYGMLPYLLSMVTTYEFNWLLKGWIAMLPRHLRGRLGAPGLQHRLFPRGAPDDPPLGHRGRPGGRGERLHASSARSPSRSSRRSPFFCSS